MRTERADIQQVIQQMRGLREQARPAELNQLTQAQEMDGEYFVGSAREATKGSAGFNDLFKNALDSVNNVQQDATTLAKAYEMGEPGVDLTRVMIASQKASISFQAAMQVRNKLVNAYQEVMNMPI